MTEIIEHQGNEPDNGEKFKVYYAMVKFKVMQEGNLQVAARDKDHAREMVKEFLKDKENCEIFQILEESEIEQFKGATNEAPQTLQ